MKTWTWLVAALSAITVAAAACTGGGGGSSVSPATSPAPGLTQSDSGEGGVTVEASWLTAAELDADSDLADAAAAYPIESFLLVRVRMDTHSGDLSSYDLAAGSEMVVDGGPPQAAVAWRPLGGSSHHREALLVFERPQGAASVEVTLKDLAGVARRVFRWAPLPGG